MDKKDNCVILLCILQQDTSRKNYFYSYCHHDLSNSFSMVPPFLFFRRHTFPFIACSVLNSSASSLSQLPFPTLLHVVLFVVFLPVTRPSVIHHVYYVSIPFQCVVVQSFQNCVTRIVSLISFFTFNSLKSLQLFSKIQFCI